MGQTARRSDFGFATNLWVYQTWSNVDLHQGRSIFETSNEAKCSPAALPKLGQLFHQCVCRFVPPAKTDADGVWPVPTTGVLKALFNPGLADEVQLEDEDGPGPRKTAK
eukprot:6185640-Amphidinium_carterae.2